MPVNSNSFYLFSEYWKSTVSRSLSGETFDIRLFRLTCTLHLIKNGQTLRILPRSQICQEEIQRSLGSYSVLRHQKSHHQDRDIRESVLAFENVQDILPVPLSFTLKKGQILKIICSSNRENWLSLIDLRRKVSAAAELYFSGDSLCSLSPWNSIWKAAES